MAWRNAVISSLQRVSISFPPHFYTAMREYWIIPVGWFAAVNLFGFFICFLDKRRARQKAWRIAEKTFFLTALLGGGLGVWLGMYTFRHKTKHWYFVFFIPLITLAEGAAAIWSIWTLL